MPLPPQTTPEARAEAKGSPGRQSHPNKSACTTMPSDTNNEFQQQTQVQEFGNQKRSPHSKAEGTYAASFSSNIPEVQSKPEKWAVPNSAHMPFAEAKEPVEPLIHYDEVNASETHGKAIHPSIPAPEGLDFQPFETTSSHFPPKLASEQRELKRPRDQPLPDVKPSTNLQVGLGDFTSRMPSMPIYTTAPADNSLLTQPTTTPPQQVLPDHPPLYNSSPLMQVLSPYLERPSKPTYQSRPKPQCWEHGCNGRRFSTFSNLLRHRREKSGQAAKVTCPDCGEEFARTTARNGHLLHQKCKSKSQGKT